MNVYNTITDIGLRMLKTYEGYGGKVYQDAVGYWTIGWGHLVKPGDPFHPYGPVKEITQEQAEVLLRADSEEAQQAVRNYVRVPLTDNQFDALTSLAFNIGTGNFSRSSVLAALNAGDYEQAANSFMQYVYAKGQVLPGLIKRRQHEQSVFRS